MEIVSFSIDDETRRKISEIQENSSFSGRSELIRKAVENLYQETVDREKLEGRLNAVIITRHPHRDEQRISEISHEFDDIVTTQLHSKLNNKKCLEVFHTDGSADRIIEFYKRLEGSKNTESVNIIPQN